MVVTGGLYAPTIRFHDGIFYVVCTNIVHPGQGAVDVPENFIVSTTDIWSGPWSDPVYFDFYGIDPSILFDADGRTYMHGSAAPGPHTKINLFEVDLATGKKLSAERTIWEGTGGIYPEGPHLYQRDGWYYLMISEGGTHIDHMVTMARARNVWGPYEPCPANPILTARGTSAYVQCTGHCEAFQDSQGQWWGVCLGVRMADGGRYIMGRETFLTRGHWDSEWLSFERVQTDGYGLARPENASVPAAVPFVDHLYIRNAHLANYQLGDDAITLTPSPIDLSHPEESPTFVGRRQRLLTGQSSVTLAQAAALSGLAAGLACYKDELRYLRIYLDVSDGAVVWELVNKAKDIHKKQRQALGTTAQALSLRMEYTEKEYRLQYSTKGSEKSSENVDWTCLAVVDTLDMTGSDFVGPVIGIFATGSGSQKVTFHDLHID